MKNEIVVDGVTYVKKTREIGDIIPFCGMDWYIIDKFDKKLKLMLKDTLKCITYSDNDSNDWKESNVRDYLTKEFLPKLDKSKLIEMRTNYDENKFSNDKVRIPTLREVEKLPMDIRKSDDYYWTMTTSYGVGEVCDNACVFAVYSSGYLNDWYVDDSYGVRPVILIEEP